MEKRPAFQIGDQVQLKSGSPIMTVDSINERGVHLVSWLDNDGRPLVADFPASSLYLAPPPSIGLRAVYELRRKRVLRQSVDHFMVKVWALVAFIDFVTRSTAHRSVLVVTAVLSALFLEWAIGKLWDKRKRDAAAS